VRPRQDGPGRSGARRVRRPRWGFVAKMSSRKKLSGEQTHTSRLRAQGIKLVCYLNTEVDHGRSVVVHLPSAEDTIEEVFPYVQKRMQLAKQMKYVEQLFLPDGTEIKNWETLVKAATAELPIIIGCGEAFDRATIPPSMLAYQKHGGGRRADELTKHEFADRYVEAVHQRAETVRKTGHGSDSAAPRAAREKALKVNRKVVDDMRHEFMENLLIRSTHREELIKKVKSKNEKERSERALRLQSSKIKPKREFPEDKWRRQDRLARKAEAKAAEETRQKEIAERKEAARQRVFDNIEKKRNAPPLEALIHPRDPSTAIVLL